MDNQLVDVVDSLPCPCLDWASIGQNDLFGELYTIDGKPRLLDQVREQIRLRHYSIRTERVYCEWIKRFIRFHKYRHPLEMGATEVERFLSDLALRGNASASTQNQVLAALLFLYKQVLDLPWLGEVVRAKSLHE